MIFNKKLLIILLLGIVLRLILINQSFWLDETAQLIMSKNSLDFQWFGRSADFHPPLFYFLTHYWLFLSKSETMLRFLPILFGLLTIYLVYVLTKDLFNQKTALSSSFFIAISQYHIYYSQEMRMYSTLGFFGTLSMYFLWHKKWFYYLLATLALIYTHYAGTFLIVAQIFWIIIWQRQELKKFIFNLFGVILLFLPWIPQFIKQLKAGENILFIMPRWREIANLSWFKVLPLTIEKFLYGRIGYDNKVFYSVLILLLLIISGFLFYKAFKLINLQKIFVLNWFITPILLCFLLSFIIPMYQPFRLLYTIFPFYIILSVGLMSFNKMRRWLWGFLITIISLAGLFQYWVNPQFQREDWKGAVSYVENNSSVGTLVLFEFSTPFSSFQWYETNKVKNIGVLPVFTKDRNMINANLNNNSNNINQIYLFQYLQPLSDPDKNVQKWLADNHFWLDSTKDFSGVGFVYNYIK